MNLGAILGGGGAGVGSALGQALGAPGASIRNLLGWAGDTSEDASVLSAIPGIVALMGGVAGGVVGGPGGAALGATAGGGLAQALGQLTGHSAFDPVSGRELAQRATGSDLGDMGGMGVEMALDPTTYLGGLGGAKLGRAAAASRAAPAAEALAVASDAKAGASAAVARAEKAAQASGLEAQNVATKNAGWSSYIDDANAVSKAGYKEEAVAASPDVLRMNPGDVGKPYKQIHPATREELSLLGYVNPDAARGGSLNAGQLPDWAQSRGGWLMPSRERMLAEADPAAAASMLRNPEARAAIGPRIDTAGGYQGLLAEKPTASLDLSGQAPKSQADRFLEMRRGVPGLEGPLRSHEPLAQSLGESDPVHSWLRQRAEALLRSGK